MPRVLVTGANGFVGAALCKRLIDDGVEVTAAVRRQRSSVDGPHCPAVIATGDLHAGTNWTHALAGATHVVHLAARVHVMREHARDPLTEFRAVNTAGTANLARQAAAAGVKRLIYVSTIKVNGERTSGRAFQADDPPHPEDAYARSKLEAELAIRDIGRTTGMEIVIVRPPLVYGPGVKGNFLAMLKVLRRGYPLPLASCDNRRSLVGISNLVDLLALCATHPQAAGQVFLASDGEDLSTPELLERMAAALGRKVRLVPVPPAILRLAAAVTGKSAIYERLCGSLQIDSGKAHRLLGWRPPRTVSEELAGTARWFREDGH